MDQPDADEIAEFVGLGSVLAGKYRVERLLGTGGMGVVVAAQHLQLEETVAIKFLLPRALGKRRSAQRFLREARAASKLKSPHVVRVFDIDVRDDGAPFIVMEYLDGESLAARLGREGRLEPARAIDALLEACSALAEAHARGIVHRDLKPANLFIARGTGGLKVLKVLDFGISKLLGPESETDRTTGEHVLGSPPYMSPEQLAQPDRVDHRSDIWSLGVVLYEMLTAASPFAAGSFAETCAKVLHAEPTKVDRLEPRVPAALAVVVEACLRKDLAQRVQSVVALARELAPFGTERAKRSLAVIEESSAAAASSDASQAGEPVRDEPTPEALLRASTETRPAVDTGTLSAAANSKSAAAPRTSRKRWLFGLAGLLAVGIAWVAGRALPGNAPARPDAGLTPSSAGKPEQAFETSNHGKPGARTSSTVVESAMSSAPIPLSSQPKTKPLVGTRTSASASAAGRTSPKPAPKVDSVFGERR